MAEDLYSAILNSAARNAARQEMDTTALDRLAMEQQLARLLAGQRRRERQAEIWPGGTFTLVEPEKRPSNALYEVLSNARLNRGLENLAGNAAEVIFGEPTGNAVIDYGVSNIPGVGAVAIGAGGGQPGLIDILGGIGAPLKGMAVVAKPLASRIIRNASYTTGQDLGMDAARNVARNVIDRMARIQGDVTGDEIYPFIKEEMQNLGLVGARDEARIRELATGFAEDTYLRALEDLEAGKTPRLNLVLPEKENIAYKPLYEEIGSAGDGLRMGDPGKTLELGKEFITPPSLYVNNLDTRQQLKNIATDAYKKAKEAALESGYNSKQAQEIALIAYHRARHKAIVEHGGQELQTRKDAVNAYHGNIKKAFSIFHPDIQKQIQSEEERLIDETKTRYLANGAKTSIANRKAREAVRSYRQKRTTEILKELGFKNANDPRLQNYEVIGRTPEESVMKAVADDIFGE